MIRLKESEKDTEQKRIIKFYMKDPYSGEEYTLAESILDCDEEYQEELDYLLHEFKKFLFVIGYAESMISKLQYLENDEWRDVLTKYGEWNDHYEKLYQDRKKYGN